MIYIERFFSSMGFMDLTERHIIMIALALTLMYLGIVKKHEPLLIMPIAVGMLAANLPMPAILGLPGFSAYDEGGLFYYIHAGIRSGIFPPLIFLCLGAMTDFSPLLSSPRSAIIGLGGQLGILVAFFGATLIGNIIPGFDGFTMQEAAAIGKIGSSDGPTVIFLAQNLAPDLLPIIAIAGYAYMALVPAIQKPIMRLLTTDKERVVVMPQVRVVSKRTKVLFPIITIIATLLIIPAAGALVVMLMLGNLIKESGVADRYVPTLEMHFLNLLTTMIGLAVGAAATAERILNLQAIMIIGLGLLAFAFGTLGGVLIAKLLNVITRGKVNPLIGNSALSAMPMAARVSQQMGLKYNPQNHLLMHAMGPTVASTIISAIAAGIFLALFGA